MEVYVFRKDKWHQILLPADTESWSQEQKQIYGSLVVSYVEKGFSKQQAEQFAEAFLFFPGTDHLEILAVFERERPTALRLMKDGVKLH